MSEPVERIGFIRIHEHDDWDSVDIRVENDGAHFLIDCVKDPKPGQYELVRTDLPGDAE